jgi:hypothetical protein
VLESLAEGPRVFDQNSANAMQRPVCKMTNPDDFGQMTMRLFVCLKVERFPGILSRESVPGAEYLMIATTFAITQGTHSVQFWNANVRSSRLPSFQIVTILFDLCQSR